MGSGSSKASASASDGDLRARLRVSRVFNSSCFGPPSTLSSDQKEEEDWRSKGNNCTDEGENIPCGGNHEACGKLRLARPGGSSSSTTASAIGRSSNPSSRWCSRVGFNTDGIGFKLSRALSLGSAGARAHFSADLSIPKNDEDHLVCIDPGSSSDNRIDTQVFTVAETISSQVVVTNDASTEGAISGHSHRNHAQSENFDRRRSSRRVGPQESLEGSVRFSRTLSVGRLRDRVLRGTSLSEGVIGSTTLEEERSVAHTGQPNGRRAFGGTRRAPSYSELTDEVLSDSSNNRTYQRSDSRDSSYEQDSETPPVREASNRDLLDHRSSFLERRRRIRSQVRALQRLGSRFENLSGHDRSCILSGQHRTGRCTCRTSNRPSNPEDDISTRASISRIVMLAEALFEVLDEIHQQTVVLSSRPYFLSIGSVPAPKEVVECMPVKVYTKPQKHQNEEAEQCYICLVEYEEGEHMRILPCNHGFHQTCIDKWLKEIHRVCPLCRGDVCSTDVSRREKHS